MSVKGAITVAIGIVVFVIVETMITQLITGTDAGSVLIQNILLVVIGAAIVIGVLVSLGKIG